MAIDINIPIEDSVTDGSLNPVTSNAVFDALADKANTADLATVATTGDYNDLDNKPTIPASQVNSDWNATSGVSEILNKPTIPSVTGFVPYTGATNDVDLGLHDLTATQGTFATSGNPDTLTVNHSSGSGNALTITKGGSGEGVYVNKTSGSGNAVTVVGDLEATNLKRTGGTSAQFLKANGSVDSTSYQPTLVSGTDIKTLEGQSLLGAGNIDLTKSDVGLSNVDNTSDLNKPISTATQTALNAKENTITAGTTSQYYRGDKTFQTLDKTAVGLGNVDNTSDLNKPISTDTQTALNAKQDTLTLTTTGTSGAATLVGSTLNVPQYGGGGGGSETPPTHVFINPISGKYYDNRTNIATNNNSISANTYRLSSFTPAYNLTIDELRVSVSTAFTGGLIKIVIYDDENGVPKNLLFTSTTVSADTSGVKTIIDVDFTFQKNTRYWLTIVTNNNINVRAITNTPTSGTPIISSSNNINALNNSYYINSSFNTPPLTLISANLIDNSSNLVPVIQFRAV